MLVRGDDPPEHPAHAGPQGPRGGGIKAMARRTRLAAVLTLAMINVFTLAAGITVARMLPPRLAALKVPTVASKPVTSADPVLPPGLGTGPLPTSSGLQSALAGPLSAGALGPRVSAVVTDPATGQI